MQANLSLSAADKSSNGFGILPSPDAPRAIEAICDLCFLTGTGIRSELIERGWELTQSAFCPDCSQSI